VKLIPPPLLPPRLDPYSCSYTKTHKNRDKKEVSEEKQAKPETKCGLQKHQSVFGHTRKAHKQG